MGDFYRGVAFMIIFFAGLFALTGISIVLAFLFNKWTEMIWKISESLFDEED